jgi:uncharacterized SAM-binding protein YcdF (DUF218 family)
LEIVFTLKAIAKALVLPPAGPMLLALAGLLLRRRAPRTGRALVMIGAVTLFLLCLPVVAGLLARPFDRPPLDLAQAREAQAIVILGGGTRRNAPEYGGDTLGRLTLERVRYGARIARQIALPVLVTGGRLFDAKSSEAGLMRDALRDEYGVSVRWVEDRSTNTRENARFSTPLLRADGVTTVIIVAHALDMPRAIAEFESAGMRTIAAPTGLASNMPLELAEFVPSASALLHSHHALYEILANLVRAVTGG